MNILVTGARGFVGSRIVETVPEAVSCPSLRNASQETVDQCVDAFRPDVIIHTAAISDMGICEKNPDASYQANVMLPVMLAKASKKIKLIVFSSDQVYNGCEADGPYAETDSLSPANVYARHKLEMEQRVLDSNPDSILLRAEWMYDMPVYGGENRGNFLMNVIKSAIENREIAFSREQYRGLTYVREVAGNMRKLTNVPGGVYNFGSENQYSMYDTVKILLSELGANADMVQDAPKRHNLWMNCSKLAACGVKFLTTEEAFRKCVLDYNFGKENRL